MSWAEEMTKAQVSAAADLDYALKEADRAGLAFRVFDGQCMVVRKEAIQDWRYTAGSDHNEWEEQFALTIGHGINADGGTGS